ncbi:MAG TPA: DUF4157 domain-containing protein [Ktedonobacteraceae bacterium]
MNIRRNIRRKAEQTPKSTFMYNESHLPEQALIPGNGISNLPYFGHDFSRIQIHVSVPEAIQTKLTINQPGDVYEQEAERVAEQVMQVEAPASSQTPPTPHDARLGADDLLTRKEASDTSVHETASAPPLVDEVLSSGGGQPLDESTRSFMEPRFGHDFSRVRVHTDERAAESARSVNALAYTAGQDVMFGKGQYVPGTNEGKKLLAHELTHVVQQSSTSGGTPTRVGPTGDRYEQEAKALGSAAAIEPTTCSGEETRRNMTIQQQVSELRIQRADEDEETHAFPEARFAPVRKAYVDNAKLAVQESCIKILQRGLKELFSTQIKEKKVKAEGKDVSKYSVLDPTSGKYKYLDPTDIKNTMDTMKAVNLAEEAVEIGYLDARGRITDGDTEPEKPMSSATDILLSYIGIEAGWYLFALSITDGYHSVLLAVNSETKQIYWMDQVTSGYDNVTKTLDSTLTRWTKQGWRYGQGIHVGYSPTTRIWHIVAPPLKDSSVAPIDSFEGLLP